MHNATETPSAPAPQKRKPGRPKGSGCIRTPELVASLLAHVRAGKSILSWCKEPGRPDRTTIYNWRDADEPFAQQLARAKEHGDEAVEEQCFEIADKAKNKVEVLKARLQVDTRLKILANRNPARFGNKAVVEHSGKLTLEQLVTGSYQKKEPEIKP